MYSEYNCVETVYSDILDLEQGVISTLCHVVSMNH